MTSPILQKRQEERRLHREALSSKRREEIISAARQLFAENGVNNVTVDDIAKNALLTKMTLYSYFESKDAIVLGVLIEELKRLYNVLERNNRTKHWGKDEKIEAFFKLMVGFMDDFFEEIALIINPQANTHKSQDLANMIIQECEKFGGYFVNMLREEYSITETRGKSIWIHFVVATCGILFIGRYTKEKSDSLRNRALELNKDLFREIVLGKWVNGQDKG